MKKKTASQRLKELKNFEPCNHIISVPVPKSYLQKFKSLQKTNNRRFVRVLREVVMEAINEV